MWIICKGPAALETAAEDTDLRQLIAIASQCSIFCGANVNDSPAISCNPGLNALVIDFFKMLSGKFTLGGCTFYISC